MPKAKPDRNRVNVVARAHYGVKPEAFKMWGDAQPNMRANLSDGEIQLYGLILPHEEVTFLQDCFGDETAMSGKIFRERLEAITGDVTLRINSDGGDVFEASAMLQAIRERQADGHTVTAMVDGIAASAASLLAAACDRVEMAEMGFLMIHEATGGMYGRANDMENGAKLLRDMNASAAKVYAKRSGLAQEDVSAMMDSESYMSAEEAVEKGFADAVFEVEKAETKGSMERRNLRLSAVLQAVQLH